MSHAGTPLRKAFTGWDIWSDAEAPGCLRETRLMLRGGAHPQPDIDRTHASQTRVLWGGTSGGITGIHEWLFAETPKGVHVTTNESFAGDPVEADATSMQQLLDASLVAWLGHLKAAAEADP